MGEGEWQFLAVQKERVPALVLIRTFECIGDGARQFGARYHFFFFFYARLAL